jgi:hypothetical protein
VKFDDDSIAADDNLYFDGVSFDDLAEYFADNHNIPVVNQTNDYALYSFTLPDDISRRFSFDEVLPLPGLGVSVTSDQVEIDAIVVRDKSSGRSAEAANRAVCSRDSTSGCPLSLLRRVLRKLTSRRLASRANAT